MPIGVEGRDRHSSWRETNLAASPVPRAGRVRLNPMPIGRHLRVGEQSPRTYLDQPHTSDRQKRARRGV